jgi:hypothetical protein
MGNGPIKTNQILRPQGDDPLRSRHFAAFGTADNGLVVKVKATSETGQDYLGRVKLFSSKHPPGLVFWIARFKIEGDAGETFTIKLNDGDGPDGAPLDSVDVVLSDSIEKEFGLVVITYPLQGDDPIPLEFVAYGTAVSGGGPVTATLVPCDSFEADQIDPAPNWTLYCYVVNPNPPCTLTVKQGAHSSDPDSGLTF